MEELKILPTKHSPEVILNPDGNLIIRGRSIHEDVTDFFKPVESWISEYVKSPAPVTYFDINLEYFNSASAKVLINLFEKITHVQLKHKKFVFNWYYEDGDEDIYERGEYFASILEVPFNYIKVSERS
jgi:hypothetical protein